MGYYNRNSLADAIGMAMMVFSSVIAIGVIAFLVWEFV